MDRISENEALSDVQRQLREYGVMPGAGNILLDGSTAFVGELITVVRDAVDAFTASANPDVLPELERHLADLVSEVVRLLQGHRSWNIEFVRQHASRRADQKFPLDALLHSYRCIQLPVNNWIRDAALAAAKESAEIRRVIAAVAEFAIAYFDAVSKVMTADYVQRTRQNAATEGDQRTALVNLLLGGYDESDAHAARLLRRAGYLEQRQSFCVAVARSAHASEMQNAARAQRMADSISVTLSTLPIRVLTCIRDNLVTVILSGTRRLSGWTVPHTDLAERVYPVLRIVGPSAVIGLSADAPSTSHIPRAYREARLAIELAHVADRVVPYAEIPVRRMLVHIGREEMQSALPEWLPRLLQADEKSRGVLLETLRAYADADMNAQKTAKHLSIHPNTIYARLQKIAEITGKNALHYDALTEMLLAADCVAGTG